MLRRNLRLTNGKLFHAIYGKGDKAVGKFMVIYLRRNGLDHNRYGFSVSKKIGNAVERNRVKRRLRETVRLHHHRLLDGYDLIMVARTAAGNTKFLNLENEFISLLTEKKLIKECESHD